MKELSIQEKARSYDEAVEKLRNAFYDNNSRMCEEYRNAVLKTIEPIFPELAESEDEKIRKEMIEVIRKEAKEFPSSITASKADSWFAYLEKQGEQNAVKRNTMPKFNIGTWVVFNGNHSSVYRVEKIEGLRYYLRHYLGGTLSVHFDNLLLRPWTIQDAKDGDILATDNGVFIYNGKTGGTSCPGAYCGINTLRNFQNGTETHWTGRKCYPATKEQRDLLFSKIKEAGYKWDSNNKELKEIEQKPADKVEPKFHEGDWAVCEAAPKFTAFKTGDVVQISNKETLKLFLMFEDCFRLWDITKDAKGGDVLACESGWTCIFKELNHNSFGEILFDSYCFIDRTGWFCDGAKGHTLNERINGKIYPATKEQRDTLMKAMADAGYTFDFEKKELKKIEQKPEWSEEDNDILLDIDACIVKLPIFFEKIEVNGKDVLTSDFISKARKFLKSLKDRVQPQPKQEWLNELDKILETASPEQLKEWKEKYFKEDCDEWSEEDEKMLECITNYFVRALDNTQGGSPIWDDFNEKIDWLKSIRPQKHWKPSEEMLEALYRAIPENTMAISEDEMLLDKLYQGLKYGRVLSEN